MIRNHSNSPMKDVYTTQEIHLLDQEDFRNSYERFFGSNLDRQNILRNNPNSSKKNNFSEIINICDNSSEDSYEKLVNKEKEALHSNEINGENYLDSNSDCDFEDINKVLSITDRSYANKGEIKLNFSEVKDPILSKYIHIINAENFRNPNNCYCDICKDNKNYLWNYMPNSENFIKNSKPGDTNDDIILCKLCHSATHQSCYGSELLFENKTNWLCHRCTYLKSQNLPFNKISCFLCPSNELGGLMKKVDVDKWAHVECINWNGNLGFTDHKKESLQKPYNIKFKTSLICSLCDQDQGCCIQCDYKFCTIAFHVRCAKRKGLIQHWAIMQRFQGELGFSPVFCSKHHEHTRKMNRKNLESFLGKKRVSSNTDLSKFDLNDDQIHDLNYFENTGLKKVLDSKLDKSFDGSKEEKILNNLLNSKNDKFSKNKAKEEKPKKKLVKKSEETERKVEGPKNDFQYNQNYDDVEIVLDNFSFIQDSNEKSFHHNLEPDTNLNFKTPDSIVNQKSENEIDEGLILQLDKQLDEILCLNDSDLKNKNLKNLESKTEINNVPVIQEDLSEIKNVENKQIDKELTKPDDPKQQYSNIIKIPIKNLLNQNQEKTKKTKNNKDLSHCETENLKSKSKSKISNPQNKEEVKNISTQKIIKNTVAEKSSEKKPNTRNEKLSDPSQSKNLGGNNILFDKIEENKNPIHINIDLENDDLEKDKNSSNNLKNPVNSVNQMKSSSQTTKNDMKPNSQTIIDTGSYNSFLLKEEFARKLKHSRPISLNEFILKVIQDLASVRELTLEKQKIYLVFKESFWSKHLKCKAEDEDSIRKILKDNWELFMNPIHEDINYYNITAKDLQIIEKSKENEKPKERENNKTVEKKTNQTTNCLNINFVSSSPWDNINFDDMTIQKRKVFESDDVRNRNFFIKSPSLKFATFD